MNWLVQMIHVNELVQKQDIVSVYCVLLAAWSVVDRFLKAVAWLLCTLNHE